MGSDLTSCSGIYVRAEDRKTSSENIYIYIYIYIVETGYDSCWSESFVVCSCTKRTNIIHGDFSSRVAQHPIVARTVIVTYA